MRGTNIVTGALKGLQVPKTRETLSKTEVLRPMEGTTMTTPALPKRILGAINLPTVLKTIREAPVKITDPPAEAKRGLIIGNLHKVQVHPVEAHVLPLLYIYWHNGRQ